MKYIYIYIYNESIEDPKSNNVFKCEITSV